MTSTRPCCNQIMTGEMSCTDCRNHLSDPVDFSHIMGIITGYNHHGINFYVHSDSSLSSVVSAGSCLTFPLCCSINEVNFTWPACVEPCGPWVRDLNVPQGSLRRNALHTMLWMYVPFFGLAFALVVNSVLLGQHSVEWIPNIIVCSDYLYSGRIWSVVAATKYKCRWSQICCNPHEAMNR
jgi:hypothetical protein